MRRSRSRSRSPDHEQADLGHLLDREAQALAAEARVLDAAVRHVIDAPARYFADEHRADLQPIPCALRLVEVAREDAGLQPERGIVDAVESFVELAERGEHGDRTEGLLADDRLVERDVLENRRLEHRALPAAAAQHLRAARDRRT